jgi:hypothetical protein
MINIGEVINNQNFRVDWSADRRAGIQPEGFELSNKLDYLLLRSKREVSGLGISGFSIFNLKTSNYWKSLKVKRHKFPHLARSFYLGT